MNNKPRIFRAKRKDGKGWATGWYCEHHIPELEFDHHCIKVIGYHITHSLFNDEPGVRSEHEGYWIDIDPDTLQPLEQQQTLFD